VETNPRRVIPIIEDKKSRPLGCSNFHTRSPGAERRPEWVIGLLLRHEHYT
jgi:hypothetical protein